MANVNLVQMPEKILMTPHLRVKKNLEEGRGFRVNDVHSKQIQEEYLSLLVRIQLWRASLDVIRFYASYLSKLQWRNYNHRLVCKVNNKNNESIKIAIRFRLE